MYYIFAFRSRTSAIRFSEALGSQGVRAYLVNTPKELGLGCGLSVKLFDVGSGRRILSYGYSNFSGIYYAESINGRIRYTMV